jgi:hypothetical protein
MNIFKLILTFSLFITIFISQAFAGPVNKSINDKLINSYLIVEELSRDGNVNAISNKKTMFSFLTQDQKDKVNKIITMKLDNKVNL